jgi:hypothetical protein
MAAAQEEIYDLFDNPMIKSAEKALTQEQKEKYAQLGEEMYKTVDFETNEILNNLPEPMVESVLQLSVQLRSGLHPSDLEEQDIKLLETSFGEKWYEKWGYEKADLESY